MGSGKNGTFDKTPDWRQWAIMAVHKKTVADSLNDSDANTFLQNNLGSFIPFYWRLFQCQTTTYILQPIEGHGLWDGKEVFGKLPKQTDYEGQIAILTRATIRLKKLKSFWANVDGVANRMAGAPGFVTSYGIGEMPLVKQATFSIWQSKKHMKDFAYTMKEHAEVVRKTHQEKWYSEDMFVRFKVLGVFKT